MDLEPIRELLATRHGIVVSVDDPILAAVALNEIVLDQHAARVDDLLKQHALRLAEADERRLAKQRDLAKAVLGDALRQAKKEIGSAADQHRAKIAGADSAPAHALRQWRIASLILSIAAFVGWAAFLLTALR